MGTAVEHPTFRQAFRVWLKIGLLSFGGPAGQIALMHREIVEKRRWISDGRFLHALNYCMLLPGPEAQQLAIYVGWLLHRTWGGLLAGLLFIVPGALFMFGISLIYIWFGKIPWIDAGFYGVKAAVMAIVFSAVIRIGKKVLKNPLMWGLSACSFIAIFFCRVPFPAIVGSALLIGFFGSRQFPAYFKPVTAPVVAKENHLISDTDENTHAPSWLGFGKQIICWGSMWLAPILACVFFLGPRHVLSQTGLFFGKAAFLTFGGAYAVLPYVAQQAVEIHGWLTPGEMMDGLALAETTPGPLILVTQFVGFLGGWHAEGEGSRLLMATCAAGITVWVTFIPSFFFIFAGAPFIERARGNSTFSAALSAVTAAVVGVILNLAVWFGQHLVNPAPHHLDLLPLALAGVFFFMMQKLKWDVLPIIAIGALAGVILHWTGVR